MAFTVPDSQQNLTFIPVSLLLQHSQHPALPFSRLLDVLIQQGAIHVELPLASPMIFTGIRIAAVNAVGTAVFAVFVGGGGLGSILYNGIRIQNMVR